MPISQRVVQICLFIAGAIAVFGGSVQLYLGQPETTPRLDNVHRFMAGVYFSMGVVSLWAAWTIRRQGTFWRGYLGPELLLPFVIALAHRASTPAAAAGKA